MCHYNTPTAQDVRANYPPAPLEVRDEWPPLTYGPASGIVTHWPLYFEDPFVDKGAGRTDCTNPRNVYRLGWEDFVAAPYGLGRHIVNWMFLPASAVVTPPWTVMASDGKLSRRWLATTTRHDMRARWASCRRSTGIDSDACRNRHRSGKPAHPADPPPRAAGPRLNKPSAISYQLSARIVPAASGQSRYRGA